MTKVSFIVPTLNRRAYVVRAVASCLTAGEAVAGVTTEVVVLDSQSDDGSWELLQENFGADARVKLVQNKRGLGPTHSWIDGVDCATGDYLTFVWSDDYVSPHFLSRLLPMMNDRTHLAIGVGVGRDADDDTALTRDDHQETFDASDFLAGYFPSFEGVTPSYVSPVCALFSRESFDKWKVTAQGWGRATPLREQIIWRRAIGPDLMLFFTAALLSEKVAFTREQVAQFSAHPGSISISVSKYLLRSGYWLARSWLVQDSGLTDAGSRQRLLRMAAETFVLGRGIFKKFPDNAIKLDIKQTRSLISEECGSIWASMRVHHSLRACLAAVAGAYLRQFLPRRYRKLAM